MFSYKAILIIDFREKVDKVNTVTKTSDPLKKYDEIHPKFLLEKDDYNEFG